MKMKSLMWSTFFIILFSFVSCATQGSNRQEAMKKWLESNGKLKVLNTTAMINDLVVQIGGDQVDSMTLIQGELDPHSYQLVKGDDEKLTHSQIIFYNGAGLEHGPSTQHYLKNNPKAVSLGDLIFQKDPSLIVLVHGQKDPHLWMDVSLWAKAIPIIVQVLSDADPQHASEFENRGAKLKQLMTAAHQEIKQIMHEVPPEKRFLVTSHDAFNYFSRAYLSEENEVADGSWQKRFVAPEGLSPESQLSTTDIRAIIRHMNQYHVEVLFPESNVSRDSINKILQAGREQGLDLRIACCPLYVDAMGPPGSEGETYLRMMIYNAKMISRYMK